MVKVISRGAEAEIVLSNGVVIKRRLRKRYRIEELDKKIIKIRTRREARIMKKVSKLIPAPRILEVDEKEGIIKMEFINGKPLRDLIEGNKNVNGILRKIGESIAKLHANNIIHGDLTTSNIVIMSDVPYFIDFSFSEITNSLEKKGVDLHLFKTSLKAHAKGSLFNYFLQEYKKSYKLADAVIEKMHEIGKRGRYIER